MFHFFKTIKQIIVISAIAGVSSFVLFVFLLYPLHPVFFLGEELRAAAGIGNSASVPVNPINRLAMRLDEKQKQLDAREQSLNDRSATIEKQNNIWNNSLLLAIFIALAVLGGLVILNFYFDRKREKELEFLEKKDAEMIKRN